MVYEIGALRALDEAVDGLDLSALDSYVGVSAGSVIASCLANGITSAQMVRMLVSHDPDEYPFVPELFFTPAIREFVRRGLMLPRLAIEGVWDFVTRPGDKTLLQALARLSHAVPVGIFDNEPIRRTLHTAFTMRGRTDDFRELANRLTVVAVDLNSGETIRFGDEGWDHVPISRAVQASCAVPGVYPPVHIEGHECVDGVLLKTVHASVALEQGVSLLFCINPIVPVDVGPGVRAGIMDDDILVARGLPTVLAQTFRTLVHSRLRVGFQRYATRFPDADVVLLEPGSDEYRMFFMNIFSFSARRSVCELAYRATRSDLLRRRDELEPMLARHGLRLRVDVLEDESRDLWHGVGVPSGGRGRERARLDRSIARLNAVIDRGA
jgi:predicted acylesterase/phospholipase RssA